MNNPRNKRAVFDIDSAGCFSRVPDFELREAVQVRSRDRTLCHVGGDCAPPKALEIRTFDNTVRNLVGILGIGASIPNRSRCNVAG